MILNPNPEFLNPMILNPNPEFLNPMILNGYGPPIRDSLLCAGMLERNMSQHSSQGQQTARRGC